MMRRYLVRSGRTEGDFFSFRKSIGNCHFAKNVASADFRRCLSSSVSSSVYTWGTGDDGQLGHPTIEKSGFTRTYAELSPRVCAGLEGQGVSGVSSGWRHTAVCTDDGRVLTFGNSKKVLLGHDGGDGSLCLQPTHVNEGLEGLKVSMVACGKNHTAALTSDGKVFTWGWGGSFFSGCGALGLGDTNNYKRPAQVLFGGSKDVKIKKIACGRAHMIALGVEGELWTWGHGENGRLGNGTSSDQLEPFPVDYFLDTDVQCVDIACGSSFCLALTESGQIYGWGKNDQSQLGLGGGISMDVYAMEDMPRLIESLADERMVSIGAGASQSLAISENGDVYFWGNRLWMEPHKMSILCKHKIVKVDCGNGYSAALSDAGQVFTWGKGLQTRNSGVFGHGSTSRRAQPEIVPSIAGTSMKDISCGDRHVATISGTYTFNK